MESDGKWVRSAIGRLAVLTHEPITPRAMQGCYSAIAVITGTFELLPLCATKQTLRRSIASILAIHYYAVNLMHIIVNLNEKRNEDFNPLFNIMRKRASA